MYLFYFLFRKIGTPDDFTRAGAETVWKFLTCHHEQLDVFTLSTHYFNLSDSLHKDDRGYFKCLLERELISMTTKYGLFRAEAEKIVKDRTRSLPAETMNVTHDDIETCLQTSDLHSNCVNASVIINKYIRMTMEMTTRILENKFQTENIKIVHLYRDPRAILDSQVRRNNLNVTHFPKFVRRAESMCKTMVEDYHLAENLKETYPETIYTLRYETLQDNPVETIKDMFRFLGLNFGNSDEEFINKNGEPSSKFPTWRNHISKDHLEVVDKYCSDLYQFFNYVPLMTIEEARNVNNKDHLPE